MIYHAQKPNACIAYSLLQIGAITEEDADEYAKNVRYNLSWRQIVPWLNQHVPGYVEAIEKLRAEYPRPDVQPPPSLPFPEEGKGILGLYFSPQCSHAVSFENGLLLDPEEDAPGKPETWEEYCNRVDYSPVIYNVTRIP